MKQAQIILYNQLRRDYLDPSIENFCYIHHIWIINFQWQELKLNTHSKIIDYAWWRQIIEILSQKWKNAKFIISKDFYSWIISFTQKHNIDELIVVKPVENYVYENFIKISERLKKNNINLKFIEDTHSFFLSHDVFKKQYQKPPIMEYFYRFMRKKENILMENWEPIGWIWNYDKENRKFDRNHTQSWNFSLEKNKYVKEAENYYNFEVPFTSPTNRWEALQLLDYFIENHLDNFGELEDAMYQDDSYVHHSLLSTAINFWMLSPREVVQRVAETDTAMNNKEGFIRQILGWREYMYHFFMSYKETIYQENTFNHAVSLPEYFWDTSKKSWLNCLDTTLDQVQSENFSHHIQRLMIIGNFSLLNNVDPHELNKWFFEKYTDAFEWVVTPNVLSMSQFADNGKLASKPYVASANYINRMSDYCKNCRYNFKEKYIENACPFNYLYWSFVDENKEVFERWRQQFVVNNLQKVDIQKIKKLKESFTQSRWIR